MRKCNRIFFGKNCFDEHLRNRPKGKERDVVCELVQKCTKCHRTVGDLKKHVCGYSRCSNCKSYCDPQRHKCYMLLLETKCGACTRETHGAADLKRIGACAARQEQRNTCFTIWKRSRIRGRTS